MRCEQIGNATLYLGDCREVVPTMDENSVRCIVTSPPYWGGVRNYGDDRQLGMERDPIDYAKSVVGAIAETRRILTDDGSLWINIGDTYADSGKGGGGNRGDRACWNTIARRSGHRMKPEGYKPKDLVLSSFAVAEGLRQDGWYLRKTIIWQKPSATEPERLDRPSLSHEYIFLLTKTRHAAVRNPGEKWWHHSVWNMRPEGFYGHPAAFPIEMARRCIVASTDEGDTVFDPFGGAGTTAVAALENRRRAAIVELNSDEYFPLACRRIEDAQRQGNLFGDAA